MEIKQLWFGLPIAALLILYSVVGGAMASEILTNLQQVVTAIAQYRSLHPAVKWGAAYFGTILKTGLWLALWCYLSLLTTSRSNDNEELKKECNI